MSSPWHVEADKTRELAKKYRQVLDDTFTKVEVVEDIEAGDDAADGVGLEVDPESPSRAAASSSLKKRAVSAKSHIFRKGKIESKYVPLK